MRVIIVAGLTLLAGLVPALAQDRTLPAGAYRAIEVPVYQAPVIVPGVQDLRQGRSVDERPAVVRKHRRVAQ